MGLGEIRLGEMGLGEMGLGEMGQNRKRKAYSAQSLVESQELTNQTLVLMILRCINNLRDNTQLYTCCM